MYKGKQYAVLFLLTLVIAGCYYGVNEKTTHISFLNTSCLEENAWDSIKIKYSANAIVNKEFVNAIADFRQMSFPVSVIYFSDEPKELIGVEYASIRYVFNPKISNQVLDGLSPDLSEDEKKRIRNRVQQLLMHYQCEEGRKESLEFMKK